MSDKKLVYNAGGWGGRGMFQMQRVDQGQDFEIQRDHFITAPGDAIVMDHAFDGAFPNGFGSPYAIVRVQSGRFAIGNGEWYVGHCNADVQPVGTILKLGDPIARANNSLHAGWGWAEIGKWDGGPHEMGYGWNYADLFRKPLVVDPPFVPLHVGSRGKMVVRYTKRLAFIRHYHGPTYLDHWHWRYDDHVSKVVREFQEDHHLHRDGVIGRNTAKMIQEVFDHQYHNRNRRR